MEFLAALLTSVKDNSDKVAFYIAEGHYSSGIEVLPPDINESYEAFTVVENKIRFGLTAVKNVGPGVAKAIIDIREEKGNYTSLGDFIDKACNELNKKVLESLIKSGALDSFGARRSQHLRVYEDMLSQTQRQQRQEMKDQISIFEMVEDTLITEGILPDIPEYPQSQLLVMEKEMLGLYLSGHPLLEFEDEIKEKVTFYSKDLNEEGMVKDYLSIVVAGIVTGLKEKTTKSDKLMAFADLEDLTGTMEIIVFPTVYEKFRTLLKIDSKILIKGRLSYREDEAPKIIVEEITSLERGENGCTLVVIMSHEEKDTLNKLGQLIKAYPGKATVAVHVNDEDKSYMIADKGIDPSQKVLSLLNEVPGLRNCLICDKL